MATCGIDADIVARLHDRRRGHIRRWAYLKPILDSIRSYQYPPLSLYLTADVETETGRHERVETTGWISLFNLPCYGAGFRFTPHATGDDGQLDLCAFRTGSTLDSLRYLSGVLAGRHHRMRGCVAERVRVVKVESASPVPFQLDGDPAGVLPCRFEVLPGRLSIVVPPDCRRLPRSARL
jgi:diacylglycerol kinase family enzyme